MSGQEIKLTKKRGRPATGSGQTIGVRLHKGGLSKVDAWIDAHPEEKLSRPEAIRRLIEIALEGQFDSEDDLE